MGNARTNSRYSMNINNIIDSTTVIDTDPRVSNWFKPCPEGYKGEWVGDTYTFVLIPLPTQAELDAKASVEAEREAKNTGLPYLDTGITVPFTNEDAMGVLQVKAGFEMGLTSTVLYLSNGSKLPLTDTEFPDFSLWFMTNRSEFFTA